MSDPDEVDATAAPPDAKQVLLRALDALDRIDDEHGAAQRVYLTVAYAYQMNGSTVTGWQSTDDPRFVTTGLLREVAEAIDRGEGWDPAAEEDDE